MEDKLREVILKKTNVIFDETLKELKHYPQGLMSLNTYFYWVDFLEQHFSANEVMNLLNEATFDLISSLFVSFTGFYRQGMISLRSSLELTCLFVYYFDHPIEYRYFLKERGIKGPLLSELINKGNFLVKKYCSIFVNENKLKKELHTEIQNKYKILSKYVHGRLKKLQTLIAFPVDFDKTNFLEFMKNWEEVIALGNTVLAVRFANDIDSMEENIRDNIFSIIKKTNILEV